MLPSVIFWAIILGVIAFWAFAETLLVRGGAGLWRGSSAGIFLRLLATVLVVADLVLGLFFFLDRSFRVWHWCQVPGYCFPGDPSPSNPVFQTQIRHETEVLYVTRCERTTVFQGNGRYEQIEWPRLNGLSS